MDAFRLFCLAALAHRVLAYIPTNGNNTLLAAVLNVPSCNPEILTSNPWMTLTGTSWGDLDPCMQFINTLNWIDPTDSIIDNQSDPHYRFNPKGKLDLTGFANMNQADYTVNVLNIANMNNQATNGALFVNPNFTGTPAQVIHGVCNIITWNLLSACAACQQKTPTLLSSWSDYSSNCPSDSDYGTAGQWIIAINGHPELISAWAAAIIGLGIGADGPQDPWSFAQARIIAPSMTASLLLTNSSISVPPTGPLSSGVIVTGFGTDSIPNTNLQSSTPGQLFAVPSTVSSGNRLSLFGGGGKIIRHMFARK